MSRSMPAAWRTARDVVVRHAVKQRAELHDAHAKLDIWRDRVLDLLDAVALDVLNTGICDLVEPELKLGLHVFRTRETFSWYDYVENLAKDLRRPFVFLHTSNYHGAFTSVTLTRRAYTVPLVAAFHLLPRARHPSHTQRLWRFHVPPEHRKLIDNWKEACATDPELRRALRLPTLVPTKSAERSEHHKAKE